ncbi:MAG: glutamyl-tRNA amidotransferase [Anaerolineae bacterium SM23_84]|nr:MAG: glutamyl-tRNA amidotransferase [Anaerolineae bacterium SM23_84]
MQLTREVVEHVAELAKLGLTEKEIELYREQLSTILEYAAILEQLDTDAIPPTASVLPLTNVLRPDETAPSLSQEDALANAPSSSDGHFQVKAILE